MTTPGDEESRTIAEDGTQKEPESQVGGGRSSRGPALSVGGEQEPGGLVPPYDGRKESMDPESSADTVRDGVRVGGATGAVEDAEPKAPDPADTPGGRTASPGDNQPAAEMPDGTSAEQGTDITAHEPGVPTGEKGGA